MSVLRHYGVSGKVSTTCRMHDYKFLRVQSQAEAYAAETCRSPLDLGIDVSLVRHFQPPTPKE